MAARTSADVAPDRAVTQILGVALTLFREGPVAIIVLFGLFFVPVTGIGLVLQYEIGGRFDLSLVVNSIAVVLLVIVSAGLTRLPGSGAAYVVTTRRLLVGVPWRRVLMATLPVVGVGALVALPAPLVAAIFAIDDQSSRGLLVLYGALVTASIVGEIAVLATMGAAPILAADGDPEPLSTALALTRGRRGRLTLILLLASMLVAVLITVTTVILTGLGLGALALVLSLICLPYLACVLFVLVRDAQQAEAARGAAGVATRWATSRLARA